MSNDINVVRYDSSMKSEWNTFVSASKNGLFMFDRDYMDYHSDRFMDHSLLFYQDTKLLAVLPASEHKSLIVSHGGLTYGGLITDADMRQTVMMSCFQSMMDYYRINSYEKMLYKTIPFMYHKQPAEEDLFALYYFDAYVDKIEASTVVDLKNPIKMSKLRRRQANKAVREGVEVMIEDTENSYRAFMNLQDKVLFERHSVNAVHTGEEIYMLHNRFRNNIHLYSAKKNGEIIAGSIVFVYDDVVHTQYLCANDEARKIGALDATIIRIMDDYNESKKWLDFGISTENGGRYLNEGLINQKEGFGGRTEVYMTWMLMLNSEMKSDLGGVLRKLLIDAEIVTIGSVDLRCAA